MIPKVIHYCWFGHNPKPELTKKCINSWKKFCPDYEIIEWNENNYDVRKNKYMSDAYDCKKWGFVSDYARLDIIYNNGGIYLDTDVELLKPLDEFLQFDSFFALESPGIINTGLGFGSVKYNLILEKIMKVYNNISFLLDDGTLNLIPCPMIQSKVFEKLGLNNLDKNQSFNGINVFSTEYFCPKDFKTGKLKITSNSTSIHHYDASWHDDYGKYAIELRWRLSKLLPNVLAKNISLVVSNLKYFGVKTTIYKIINKK